MARQKSIGPRKHYYVAVWGYGIGCTDGNTGDDLCSIIPFDSMHDARGFAREFAFVDGHSYAEEVDSAYALRTMRKQLGGKLHSLGLMDDDVKEALAQDTDGIIGYKRYVYDYHRYDTAD